MNRGLFHFSQPISFYCLECNLTKRQMTPKTEMKEMPLPSQLGRYFLPFSSSSLLWGHTHTHTPVPIHNSSHENTRPRKMGTENSSAPTSLCLCLVLLLPLLVLCSVHLALCVTQTVQFELHVEMSKGAPSTCPSFRVSCEMCWRGHQLQPWRDCSPSLVCGGRQAETSTCMKGQRRPWYLFNTNRWWSQEKPQGRGWGREAVVVVQ